MLHHFNLAAKMDARVQGWKNIHALWHGLDRGKIVTLLEMDDCFFDPKTLLHRGAVGMRYVANMKLFDKTLQDRVNNGMTLFEFPSSQAHDATKRALQSEITRVIAATEDPDTWDFDAIEKRIDHHVEGSRLQAMVLDDYLNTLSHVFSIYGTAQFDVLWSTGKSAETILKAVDALPDYRPLFPNRGGPHNGQKNDAPRILRPVLFPA